MADARFIEILLPWSWLDWDRPAQHWSCPLPQLLRFWPAPAMRTNPEMKNH